MAQSNWEADKMLDVYIYDYLLKRNLHDSAKAFMAEGKVSGDPVGDILRKNSFCHLSVQGLPGKAVSQGGRSIRLVNSSLAIPGLHSQPFQYGRSISDPHRRTSAAVICNAALNARCGAEQTQTVTRQSSTITVAPVQGKEKSPELDDGGTGFPPRDDDGGGGGGGGGGPGWSGGFFFFGLLAFLGFMKDKESEGPYSNNRRRR